MEHVPYIQLKEIHKTFGSVVANHGVNLSVERGEIHALLGENGSGKSTLVNMLAGIYTPDSGEILVDGKQAVFQSPRDSISAGIGMVHQHFKLVDVFTVQENIMLGSRSGFFINRKQSALGIQEIADKYGLDIDPAQKIYNLSVGEKQTVEILKTLYRGANVLILDEPTAVLAPQEISRLFEILREMKRLGNSVIIITHKMNEVLEISDQVTVLRKGETIGTVKTRETSARALTEMMVGRSMSMEIARPQIDPVLQKPILKVDGLCAKRADGVQMLRNMSFELSSGEILGIAGIAGSGQKELCEIIAGLDKASSGAIEFRGESILGLAPTEIMKRGIQMSFIPEDRLGMGLVAGMDIVDNVLLKSFRQGNSIFVDRASGRKNAQHIVQKFGVDTPSVNHVVKKLSGGNIQKVLLGREIDLEPTLLVTAYPVRGLDIGASYFIYDTLNEQKEKGVGVLFIGEDLDILMQISDRLMVIHDGEVMGIVDPRSTSKEQIGLMMLGQTDDDGEVA